MDGKFPASFTQTFMLAKKNAAQRMQNIPFFVLFIKSPKLLYQKMQKEKGLSPYSVILTTWCA